MFAQIISDILNITIAAKENSKGKIVMLSEHLSVLFHLSEVDIISCASSSKFKAINTIMAYSGSPVGIVTEGTPTDGDSVLIVAITPVNIFLHSGVFTT